MLTASRILRCPDPNVAFFFSLLILGTKYSGKTPRLTTNPSSPPFEEQRQTKTRSISTPGPEPPYAVQSMFFKDIKRKEDELKTPAMSFSHFEGRLYSRNLATLISGGETAILFQLFFETLIVLEIVNRPRTAKSD